MPSALRTALRLDKISATRRSRSVTEIRPQVDASAALAPDDDNDIVVHDNVPSYDVSAHIQQSATENEQGETLHEEQQQPQQDVNVIESYQL